VKDQFDVWRFNFQDKGGEHPVVLISHPDICARSAVVNVLFCTSQRQSRRPYPHEVMLADLARLHGVRLATFDQNLNHSSVDVIV
jgi:mRNA-degrading endonuclease toxin of MazEF toxin-antitoxin module